MMQRRSGRISEVDRKNVVIDASDLIQCVRKRPVLYNYQLDPERRRRIDVAAEWMDVAEELGGNATVAMCRHKWKSLRDTYHQYRLNRTKYGMNLKKWRHSKEMSFLADIYRPKLKSERSKYKEKCKALQKDDAHKKVDQIKISAIVCSANFDENESKCIKQLTEEISMDEDYVDDNDPIEHEIDFVEEVTLSDEEAVGNSNNNVNNEPCLYDEGAVHFIEETEAIEYKPNTNGTVDETFQDRRIELTKADDTITDSINDELDLFFKFLKTKMRKLSAVDVTGIQIEILHAVLRKESARSRKS